MYLPVQMGHAIHPGIGYIGDDTGENISCLLYTSPSPRD